MQLCLLQLTAGTFSIISDGFIVFRCKLAQSHMFVQSLTVYLLWAFRSTVLKGRCFYWVLLSSFHWVFFVTIFVFFVDAVVCVSLAAADCVVPTFPPASGWALGCFLIHFSHPVLPKVMQPARVSWSLWLAVVTFCSYIYVLIWEKTTDKMQRGWDVKCNHFFALTFYFSNLNKKYFLVFASRRFSSELSLQSSCKKQSILFSISNCFPIFSLLWVQFTSTLILSAIQWWWWWWGLSLGSSHYSTAICGVNILLLIAPGDRFPSIAAEVIIW